MADRRPPGRQPGREAEDSLQGGLWARTAARAQSLPALRAEVDRARDDLAVGDAVAARSRLERIAQEAPRQGEEVVAAMASSLLARAYLTLGETDLATEASRRSVDLFAGAETRAVGPSLSDYGVALYLSGQPAEAVDALRLAADDGEWPFADTYRYLGKALLDLGDFVAAEPPLRSALELAPSEPEIHLSLAQALVKQEGRRQDAAAAYADAASGYASLDMFEEALKTSAIATDLDPGNASILQLHGEVLRYLGRLDEALVSLDEALEIDANDAYALSSKGVVLAIQDEPEEALAYLDRALELMPDHVFALASRGQVNAILGRDDAALADFERALLLDPDSPIALAGMGDALLNMQRANEAADLYRSVLERQPGNIGALYGLALAQAALGETTDALQVLETLASQSPTDPDPLRAAAELLLRQGEPHAAVDRLKRALNVDPDDVAVLELLARTYARIGAFDRAVHVYELAAERDPQSWWLRAELGESLRRLDRNDEALLALDEAAELDPDNAYVLGTRGQVLDAVGKTRHAIECLQRATKLEDAEAWNYVSLAEILAREDRLDDAKSVVDRAVNRFPDDRDVAIAMGLILMDLDRPAEAVPYFESAADMEPTPEIFVGLGEAHLFANELERAEDALSRALDLQPENPVALARLGQVDRARPDAEMAVHHLQQATELDPTLDWAREELAFALIDAGESDGAALVLRFAMEDFPERHSLGALLGLVLLDRRPDEARELLADAISRGLDSPEIVFSLADAYRISGDVDQAAVLVETSGADWADPGAHAARAETLRALGRYEPALAAADRALELDPESVAGLEERGAALASLGPENYDQALASFREAIRLDPQDAGLRIDEAEILRLMGELDGAQRILSDVLGGDPENALALGTRGQVYDAQDRMADAKEDLIRATTIDPGLDWAHAALGSVHTTEGSYEDAVRAFDTALDLNPDQLLALNGRALVLWQLNDPGALAAADAALERDPDSAYAMVIKGSTLRLDGETTAAHDMLQRAVEADPELGYARAELGEVLRQQGNLAEAERALHRAVDLEPDNSFALGTLGQVLGALGRHEEAIAALERAAQIESDTAWIQTELGSVLLAVADWEQAVDHFERAVKLNPADSAALAFMASALTAMGRTTEAAAAVERALALTPDDGLARAVKAQILLNEGALNRALEVLDEVLEEDPEYRYARSLRVSALTALNQHGRALADAEWLVDDDPSDSWSIALRGQVLLDTADFDEAAASLLLSLDLNPEEPYAHLWLGWALISAGRDLDEAASHFERAIELGPDETSFHVGLGEGRWYLGELDAAMAEFEYVIRQSRGEKDVDVDDLWDLGWCNYRLGRYSRATRLFTRAVAGPQPNLGTHFDVALSLLAGGDGEAAAREYRRTLKLTSDLEDVRRQRGLLTIAKQDLDDADQLPQVHDSEIAARIRTLVEESLEEADSMVRQIRT